MSSSDKSIILATNNANKVQEIREILSGQDIMVLPLKETGIEADIEETGDTFEENALIKARAVCALTGKPALADDSGLCIDHLDGAPGVYSSRFMGEDTPYSEKNAAIIEKLSGVPAEERGAAFHCVMALVFPDGREFTAEGKMPGIIANVPAGENGFGYDPILFLPEYGMTSAQLSPEEKNAVSHRGEALRKMLCIIEAEVKI